MTEPAALIADLASALEAGRDPDPAAAAQFAKAVQRWLNGEAKSLDVALGIGGQAGLEHARNRYRRAQRDRHLNATYQLAAAPGPWTKCLALAAAIKYFESRIWPRWQDLDEPPAGCSEINAHLFHARRYNARPLPATAEGIRQRITQEQPARDLASAA